MNVAVDQIKTSYDEVPYTSHPFSQTAPEHLAAIAQLFALNAPDPATSRVLELGCASGGNLIPFASRHPASKALGIDLSGVQIELGHKRVGELGLPNVELREADLSTLDIAELGTFDYIICHGVYSWVPQHVQDAILRICRENLAPDGIAYVSYNTYPGWKSKEIVRDAMILRGGPRATPAERLGYARGMIDFLEQVAPKNSLLSKVLSETVPHLRGQADYYLSHEYLEHFNTPCYFREFLNQANAKGLAYLAEAAPSTMFAGNFGAQVAEPLFKECGHSQVLIEQYLDFVSNRTFRQTLLVHESRAEQIRYRLDAQRIRTLHFAATLPCTEGSTKLDGSTQEYGLPGRPGIVTCEAEVKLAIDALNRAWPETISFPDLLARVAQGLDGVPQDAIAPRIDHLLELLIMRGVVSLRSAPVRLASAPDGKLYVTPAARRLAAATRDEPQSSSFNAWHEPVLLGHVDRWLLPELDGSRDRDALVAALQARVDEGKVRFLRDGEPVTAPADVAACIAEHVDGLPARLAGFKLTKAP